MSAHRHNKRKALRIEGSRRAALNKAHGRLVVINGVFVILFIVIAARAFDLSILQGMLGAPPQDYMEMRADSAKEPVIRADITDRNGVLLATSLKTASLYADPALIPDAADVAQGIVGVLPELTYGSVLQKLQRKGRFVWIKRNLTPDQQFDILSLGHPGLNFREEYTRIYPQGRLAAHMVGYTNVDGRGLAGIERSMDQLLSEGGSALELTLDVRLQHILRRETMRALETFSAKGAAGTIIDIGTGEILAAVSLPDFDPHDPGQGDKDALFNRLTLGVYELGSTFKIFSTAALLEHRDVTMAQTFDAREPIKKGRFTISDYHAEERVLTLPEVFMVSSNIGSALMGEMVGGPALRAFYDDLGLFRPLMLEIDEIGRPLVPSPWREINTLTAAYGHGIAVTPLQMASAAATIINGGYRVDPTLILGRNVAKKSRKSPDVRVVSPQTSHRLRQLMRLVVTDGTGTKADIPGYRVGGKTGTAEKVGENGYDRGRVISSFIGIFPMDEPRYAVFVMVDEPQGTEESFGYATGGWVAAPAVGRIIAGMGAVLGIKPQPLMASEELSAPLKKYVHLNEEEGKSLASY